MLMFMVYDKNHPRAHPPVWVESHYLILIKLDFGLQYICLCLIKDEGENYRVCFFPEEYIFITSDLRTLKLYFY